jgi:GH25 family lysozyme M1 (1,4-beta-N-acetylmuramidase)
VLIYAVLTRYVSNKLRSRSINLKGFRLASPFVCKNAANGVVWQNISKQTLPAILEKIDLNKFSIESRTNEKKINTITVQDFKNSLG